MDKALLAELSALSKREEIDDPEGFQLLDKYVGSEKVFSQVSVMIKSPSSLCKLVKTSSESLHLYLRL